ncbi:class I tRNA ligase family protein [Aquifex aeolicus]|uniref:Leucine--tRNA ligase subunit beta n=1 Tax=Aquifex aeolicus (strain VF5) TaxID=224324 RepID=SYLB_AQUAE|nr:class I tRNA ligase family protein [Aquifex aeolicus]O67646.1 RecName: Full=Leucine--tRNA ligase subunit beta; AltName: Full=Leucyl-tRNA synthetase subunit beta; Short=LeuRS [Aquifex aeolicus VF5]AAC07608.1 leucyl-tRNA synthetase beta subunit [Aquifex aeolicus VF5]
MKIKDFLQENKISVGDNAIFLLEKLGIKDENLIKFLEREIGESAKMSKSKANVVDPEEAVEKYGADTVRLYILFAAPPEQDFEWTDEGIQGAYRFLQRYWNFVNKHLEKIKNLTYTVEELRNVQGKAKEVRREIHQTIADYRRDFEERYQFNTAIAKIMKLLNTLQDFSPQTEQDYKVLREGIETITLLLSPITPHIAEEVWEMLGNEGFIINQPIPEPDPEALKVEEIEIPVQVNGKLRARVKVPADADEETVKNIVLSDERVQKWVQGKEVKKFIYVKGKLVNVVVK